MDHMRGALSEMSRLLREYGFSEEMAQFPEELLRLESQQDPAFLDNILSNEMWGGAGALWELLLGAGRDEYGPHTLRDQALYEQALVTVGEELQRLGVVDPRVQNRVHFLRERMRLVNEKQRAGGDPSKNQNPQRDADD